MDAAHPSTAVFLQDACLLHKYIRTRDSSHIVERPERLRAVKIGVCAAISRLEETHPVSTSTSRGQISSDPDSLLATLENLKLETPPDSLLPKGHPVQLVQSSAKVDLLRDSAVEYIHGDVGGDAYLEKLTEWARHSIDKISTGQPEIPSELPQGDLYLCPTSLDAFQGALGTVCEAVDTVMKHPAEKPTNIPRRAFVAVRPPGHHCGEDTPCGFCFVNNVAVGAAHAHLKHGVNRVVILDIDLHHGNGTQSIVWQINEEAYRVKVEADAGAPAKPSLQIYYGSVHDVLSFPCEDGKPDMIQAASVSIHGPHGQHIENVHLEPFESEGQFWEHYHGAYSKLFRKAEDFIKNTGGASSDETLVLISAGFDASEYEAPSMSRHNRKVPTSFFYHFTRDACAFANKWANGRIVSVLEGGYSDKALISGAMAHLTGLVDGESASGKDGSREPWWSPENLQMLEKLSRKSTSAHGTKDDTLQPWFDRTSDLLAILDPRRAESSSKRSAFIPPSSMTLRARKSNNQETSTSPTMSPDLKKENKSRPTDEVADALLSSESIAEAEPPGVTKKLPRVILKVGPRREA